MKCFKIESIEYGWFECRIGKWYIEVSDFLGYDFPKEFLAKLNRVLRKSTQEWLYVMNEPGAAIVELLQTDDAITVNVYSMLKPSDELDSDITKELNSIGKCEFSSVFTKLELVDAVVTEYSLYENGNGRNYYVTNWGGYPQKEYIDLKRIAFEIKRDSNE